MDKSSWLTPEEIETAIADRKAKRRAEADAKAPRGGRNAARGKTGSDEAAVRLEDFVAYMQSHDCVFMPAGDFWPAARVNARLPPIPLVDKSGKPVIDEKTGVQKEMRASDWLAKHAPVEQMTWAPGLPQLVPDKLISEGGWIDRKV